MSADLSPGEMLAREIAAGLGPEWAGTMEVERDGSRSSVIELVKGNARVCLHWNEAMRGGCEESTHYRVTGRIEYPLSQHATRNWPTINISRQKSPARIAREIERRLLPDFLVGVCRAEQNFAAHTLRVQLADQWARYLVEASAGQLEGKLSPDQLGEQERLRYWPRSHPGGGLISGAERIELTVQAETRYHPGVEMSLLLASARAERVIHFLWEQGFFALPNEKENDG